ncbi:nucleoporin [Culex quinquefasciatus]|uniref:Nucleoporin n=1 Tax=Culex quinquefasciatus TaxID=7176 RepID=B0WI92_CULQU|nr:nucleoporin [Culex quinquefasciatus]|eukprot:XP_001848426.1 nucleoporin [Culex quinquefasciatus]
MRDNFLQDNFSSDSASGQPGSERSLLPADRSHGFENSEDTTSGTGTRRRRRARGRAEKTRHKNEVTGIDSAGSSVSSSVFDAFKGFAGHLCHDQPEQASLFWGWNPAEGGHTGSAGKGTADEEYAANVKALKLAEATWISEKVKENPVCKLTPIFKITKSIWMRSRPRRVTATHKGVDGRKAGH